jgi:hypothetical protein
MSDLTRHAASLCARAYDFHLWEFPESRMLHNVPFNGYYGGTVVRVPMQRNSFGGGSSLHVIVADCPEDGTLIIAFEGSNSPEAWLYNIGMDSVDFEGLTVHEGFASLAMEVVNFLLSPVPEPNLFGFTYLDSLLAKNNYRNIHTVVFTGHSAGGALATLVPWYLSKTGVVPEWSTGLWNEDSSTSEKTTELYGCTAPDLLVIDFATPRFLSPPPSAGSSALTHPGDGWCPDYERYRHHHILDIVPHTPLAWAGPFPKYHHWGSPMVYAPSPAFQQPLISSEEHPMGTFGEIFWFLRVVLYYIVSALTRYLPNAILFNHSMTTYRDLLYVTSHKDMP